MSGWLISTLYNNQRQQRLSKGNVSGNETSVLSTLDSQMSQARQITLTNNQTESSSNYPSYTEVVSATLEKGDYELFLINKIIFANRMIVPSSGTWSDLELPNMDLQLRFENRAGLSKSFISTSTKNNPILDICYNPPLRIAGGSGTKITCLFRTIPKSNTTDVIGHCSVLIQYGVIRSLKAEEEWTITDA